MNFLRVKHGLDAAPQDDTQPEPQPTSAAPATSVADAPQLSDAARLFNVHINGERFEVVVDPADAADGIRIATAPPQAPAPETATTAAQPESPAPSSESDTAITAPIPGVVLRYEVEVGQSVQQGDEVVVLEAMKMENTLPSPVSGVVKELAADLGATVAKDAVLAIITAED